MDTDDHQLRYDKTLKITMHLNKSKQDFCGLSSYFEQDEKDYSLPPSMKIIPTTLSIPLLSGPDNDFLLENSLLFLKK